VSGATIVDGRYVAISADCHAGADQMNDRPYLESTRVDDFGAPPAGSQSSAFTE
jgi:hypothetical protein